MKERVAEATSQDEDLVRRAQDGDEAAFDSLVRRYLSRSSRIASRFCSDVEDAADAVQETFLRLYSHLDKFDFRGKFSTWFFRILANTCLNQVRASQQLKRLFLRPQHLPTDSALQFSLDDFAGECDPHTERERQELRHAIEAGLRKLPAKLRLVLILYDLEGFSQREIAEMLGIPQGTVMSRLYHARRAMQPLLRDFHES